MREYDSICRLVVSPSALAEDGESREKVVSCQRLYQLSRADNPHQGREERRGELSQQDQNAGDVGLRIPSTQ